MNLKNTEIVKRNIFRQNDFKKFLMRAKIFKMVFNCYEAFSDNERETKEKAKAMKNKE